MLETILLLTGIVLYLLATMNLVKALKNSVSLDMGDEMSFSNLWIVASMFFSLGILGFLNTNYWPLIPSVIVLYFLSLFFRRILKGIFLGRGLNKNQTPSNNFKTFSKSLDTNNDS